MITESEHHKQIYELVITVFLHIRTHYLWFFCLYLRLLLTHPVLTRFSAISISCKLELRKMTHFFFFYDLIWFLPNQQKTNIFILISEIITISIIGKPQIKKFFFSGPATKRGRGAERAWQLKNITFLNRKKFPPKCGSRGPLRKELFLRLPLTTMYISGHPYGVFSFFLHFHLNPLIPFPQAAIPPRPE